MVAFGFPGTRRHSSTSLLDDFPWSSVAGTTCWNNPALYVWLSSSVMSHLFKNDTVGGGWNEGMAQFDGMHKSGPLLVVNERTILLCRLRNGYWNILEKPALSYPDTRENRCFHKISFVAMFWCQGYALLTTGYNENKEKQIFAKPSKGCVLRWVWWGPA